MSIPAEVPEQPQHCCRCTVWMVVARIAAGIVILGCAIIPFLQRLL